MKKGEHIGTLEGLSPRGPGSSFRATRSSRSKTTTGYAASLMVRFRTISDRFLKKVHLANARLIAAAPKLLAACEEFVGKYPADSSIMPKI